MRESKIKFLEKCTILKEYFKVSNYVLYDYENGCIADFSVTHSINPRSLLDKIGDKEVRIIPSDDKVRVRLFENFKG